MNTVVKNQHYYQQAGIRFIKFTLPIYAAFFILVLLANLGGALNTPPAWFALSIAHLLLVELSVFICIRSIKTLNRQILINLLWWMNFNNIFFYALWFCLLEDFYTVMYMVAMTSTISLFAIAKFWQSLLFNALIGLCFFSLSAFKAPTFSLEYIAQDSFYIVVFLVTGAWLSFLCDRFTRQRQKLINTLNALQDSQQAYEEESRAKSEFLAKMSHEIRTPMNGMLGMIDLLQDGEESKERQQYLETAHNSGQLLLHVVNDILDFSKIEANELQLEYIPFNLPLLLNECLASVENTAADKQIRLDANLDFNPENYIGDPNRLKQILLNLLSNAIKFTETGVVRIKASATHLDNLNALIHIKVTDTGIGMSPSQRKQLFQPFQQADSSISRTFGGTGLGLAICKQLVDLMGGSIHVLSKQKLGTSFTVHVPMLYAEKPVFEAPKERSSDAQQLSDLHLVVVDDNPVNCMVILGLLEKLGIHAHTFNNGESFLDYFYLEHHDIDIVLMDCEMPTLSGYETSIKVRAFENEHHLKPTPICAFTAHAIESYIEQCYRAGMNDVLVKPVQLKALRQKLVMLSHEFLQRE